MYLIFLHLYIAHILIELKRISSFSVWLKFSLAVD